MGNVQTAKNGGVMTFLKKNISLAAFIVLFVLFTFTTKSKFLTADNLLTILGSSIVLLICSLGGTFIILLGSIDLSTGSMISLCGVIAAKLYVFIEDLNAAGTLHMGTAGSLMVAILGAVGVSLVAYLLMGLTHAFMKIPTFIVSLGMLSIARATVTMVSGGKITMIPFESPFVKYLGARPWILILGLLIFLVIWMIERFTLFGRYTRLIGGDETVARLSGIRVSRQKILVFLFAGVLTAIGGLVMAARIGSGSPSVGQGYELNVISAVVLGGTSQRGGIGGVKGTLIGAVTLTMLANGLVLWGMPNEIQLLIKGLIVILAVYISLERTPNMVIK